MQKVPGASCEQQEQWDAMYALAVGSSNYKPLFGNLKRTQLEEQSLELASTSTQATSQVADAANPASLTQPASGRRRSRNWSDEETRTLIRLRSSEKFKYIVFYYAY